VLTRERVSNVYRTTWTDFPEYTYYIEVNGEMVPMHGGGSTTPVRQEGDFDVIDAAQQYWYTSVELKPAWHFGRVTLELQCLFNFFTKPRVLNWMYGNPYYTSKRPYYTTSIGQVSKNDQKYAHTEEMGKGDLYLSNEIGITLKYRLGKGI
jgi:hypothetical protein